MAVLSWTGCAARASAVRATGSLAPYLAEALYDEPDFELARAAAYSSVTMLEALSRAVPGDADVATRLAEVLGGTAAHFLSEPAPLPDAPLRGEDSLGRARELFRRGREAAGRALAIRRPVLGDPAMASVEHLRDSLVREGDRDVIRTLFWYAFNWAGELEHSPPSVGRARDLSRVRLIVNRVVDVDHRYFHGVPVLLQAMLLCATPTETGRVPVEARALFESAIAVSGGHLLLARVEYARLYSLPIGDRATFDREIRAVLDAPLEVLPGYRLLTVSAKRQAEALLRMEGAAARLRDTR